MRLTSSSVLGLAIAAITLAACGASLCASVTLDAATKSATSDSPLLEAGRVRSNGAQIGLYIQSKSLAPQSVTVKVAGLKDARYDVYVNWGAFRIKRNKELAKLSKAPDTTNMIEPGYVISGKSAADLAEGLSFQIPGRVVPSPLMRCVTSVQPTVKSAYDGLGDTMTGDVGRARWTLGQAADWVRSAISADEAYRSVQFFLIPAGITPVEMDWRSRLTAAGTKGSAAYACSRLQQARVTMYENLTDALLRETTVGALTPVEAHIRYYMKNQTPCVAVEIVNYCDLSISGKLDLTVPKGWKMEPKQIGFASLKSGAIYAKTIRLTSAPKGQSAPASLSAIATIRVANGETFAKLHLVRMLTLTKE